jgi:glycosyltransferase involved in cell wall biosynthesis
LVPHGTFDTVERDWVPLATRPHQIVTMGKFGTYKKLETLIAAFDILRQDPALADYKLIIGGSDHPNTPGYFDGLARKHADDTSIVFHGYVAEDDIARFFETAQLSVFDYEATTGSSGVLHQTASYGTLPVFPEIGDFVDVARDEGITGYNYQPGNAQDMADAMRRALSDMESAEVRAKANRDASMDMPLSKVATFHIDKICELSKKV